MKKFIETLNSQLNNELQRIETEELHLMKRLKASTLVVLHSLNTLKDFVSEYEFQTIEEEIRFFKEQKPAIFSQLIYFKDYFRIEARLPSSTNEAKIDYYKKELDKISQFFSANSEFYQYYQLGSTYLDEKYFMRELAEMLFFDSQRYYTDAKFSSSHDILVSRILSNERLIVTLNNSIARLSGNYSTIHVGEVYSPPVFQWTESKTSLVELIYALAASGAVNSGNCEIKELLSHFERCFNVKVPEVYRTYSNLKIRSDQTRFIDNLKSSLMKKFEQDI